MGGVAEIVDGGRAGLLVAEGDVLATANGLQRMLADSALRQRCATAGRERARRLFDGSAQARVLRGWFDESVQAEEAACASPA